VRAHKYGVCDSTWAQVSAGAPNVGAPEAEDTAPQRGGTQGIRLTCWNHIGQGLNPAGRPFRMLGMTAAAGLLVERRHVDLCRQSSATCHG
jgi:hypothetical protein